MIKVITFFLVLLLSVWMGVKLHNDPGYILVSIHHWTIESTLLVGIGFLILSFLVFHLFLVLLSWLDNFPTSLGHWRAKRRALAAQTKTRQGLIEFSEGHWKSAKNHLIKALPDADTPLLNYLTAARAAQEMGDYQMRDNYLREAQQCMPEAKIAVELTQAQLQLANRQWEQALATLRHLKDLSPNHTYVLKLLSELYQEVKDWQQLIFLLPDLKRNHVFVGEALQRLQHRAYLQGLIELVKQGNPTAVDVFIGTIPKALTQDPELVTVYSTFLIKIKEDNKAEQKLRECLRHEFNESLVDCYGEINSETAKLEFLESLLKKHPHSASLKLALGRQSRNHQLWGKAKNYFEESIQLKPIPEAFFELGKLLEQLEDRMGAFAMYRQGLLLAIDHRSDLYPISE